MRHRKISSTLETSTSRTSLVRSRGWRGRPAVLGLAVILMGATAWAGDPPPDGEADAPSAVSQGVLPIPRYGGSPGQREYLTGDWGGTRQGWAERGFGLRFEWYQVGQGVVSGGRNNDWKYGTNLDLYAHFDLMRAGLMPGAVISFRAQSRFGETVNGDSGLLFPVNTFSLFPLTDPPEANVPIAITELNYLQFFSEHFGIQFGKITTLGGTNEFAGGEGRSQFMNLQLAYPAVFNQFVPYSTLAAGVLWLPSEKVNVASILMNLTDASTTTGFSDIGDGTIWSSSVSVIYGDGGLPGGLTVGTAYAFNGEFVRVGEGRRGPGGDFELSTESETWAVFVTGWQYLHLREKAGAVDPANGRQDLRGLGAFLTVGVGRRSTSPAPFNVALGLGGRGMIGGRPDDSWGVGWFFNDVQDNFHRLAPILPDRVADSNQGVEAYYNAALAGSVGLTLDLQWTKSAFRCIDNAFILAFRLNIRL